MTTETTASLLSELTAKFNAGDVTGGLESLSKIKIQMLESPPGSEQHMLMAAQALEIGILLTVKEGDMDAFGRNVAQLKTHYAVLRTTPRKCHILGLNLMHLLVENRLSEFHAELELLTEEEAGNAFVSFPINLERQLMVGIYDEILNVTVPDEYFQVFVDNLLQTVRDSIADCVEVSYKTMKLADAMVMMKFDSQPTLLEYVDNFRDDWIVQGDTLCFQPPPSGSKASDIPSMKLISQSLSYATEMERIV
jgi:26S proteasome regulatory subunit N12